MKASNSWGDHAPCMPHLNIVPQREIKINMKDEILAAIAFAAVIIILPFIAALLTGV